jgi:hypothetical protein
MSLLERKSQTSKAEELRRKKGEQRGVDGDLG